jgi:citrate lyase subunit beta/citryl-CoA lyase
VQPRLGGLQLPKVESAEQVVALDRRLGELEQQRHMAPGATRLIVTIESARGVLDAAAIAAASDRILGVMPAIGENGDLQRDLGYVRTDDHVGSVYVRSALVLTARATGRLPLDGAYMGTDDAGFREAAAFARRLGYQGKKLSDPRQVELAHEIFG